MSALRRILVSIKDPARGVTPAVSKAAQLARASGARLELFHAITTPLYLDIQVYSDWTLEDTKRELMKARTEQMQRIAKTLMGRAHQQALRMDVTVVWDWPGYAAIVRRAVEFRADLVVADRHAGRHLARAVMRFADWELLRLCPVPVLLVGSQASYERPVTLAAVDPAHLWEKSAQLDERILRVAASVNGALGGTLHAVHAYVSSLPVSYPTTVMYPKFGEKLAHRLSVAAKRRFERVMRGKRIARGCQHLVDASPIIGITDTVRSIRADLIVMGAVSRSGIRRLLIGNTAESLLDRLSCDLLIVKPARFKARVARASNGVRVIPALPMTI